jgi:hypothetical protein
VEQTFNADLLTKSAVALAIAMAIAGLDSGMVI